MLYRTYSKEEIQEAVDSLIKNGLFRIIQDVFPGEMRYQIADESLRSFIKDVWHVHVLDFLLMDENLGFNNRPTEEDEKYLELLYDEKIADRLLALTYSTRISYKKEINSDKKKWVIADLFIRDFDEIRKSLIQDIIKRHEKVIKEYEIVREMAKEILHPSSRKEFQPEVVLG